MFQNLIISNKFIFPLNNFMKYIKSNINSSNNNNNNNCNIYTYKYQLIQFKDIERVKLPSRGAYYVSLLNDDIMLYNKKRKRNEQDDSKGGSGDDNDGKEYQQYLNGRGSEYVVLKRMLNIYCPNLKKVWILHKEYPKFNSNYDCTCGGFFNFKKLFIQWDHEKTPCSFGESDDIQYRHEFEYSFKFISNYNPNKIYFSTIGSDMELQLATMDNLLNFKSIKSMKFIDHITPLSLITNIFQSSNNGDNGNLVSLHLRINESEVEFLKCLAASGIESNKTIKKLIIRQFTRHNGLNGNSCYVSEFLEIIKPNKTLSSIGLEFFGTDICNLHLFSPLKEMNNINTLSCGSFSLKLYFNHCNENSNIKKLVIYQQGIDNEQDDQYEINIQLFETFIKNNNSSLEIIKFVYLDIFSSDPELAERFNNLLITNNYNNNEKGSKNLKLIHYWGGLD